MTERDSCFDTTKLTDEMFEKLYEAMLDGLGSRVLARWATNVAAHYIETVESKWEDEINKLIHERYKEAQQSTTNMIKACFAGVEWGQKETDGG